MNTTDLYREIKRLQLAKLKNEAAVSAEDLAGKYRASYERLCGNIKQVQMEYRTECTKVIRGLTEIFAELAYFEPTDEEYEMVMNIIFGRMEALGNDPILLRMVDAIMHEFGEAERVLFRKNA